MSENMLSKDEFNNKYSYDKATPMMQQYLDIKFENQDSLVLFRMGDFYELFFEDATHVSKQLGLVLAKRGKHADEDLHMCGMPHHALENYLNRLVESGARVAICDQLESPEEAKKRGGYKAVVKRDITSIITPGTITIDGIVDNSLPNYLVSICERKHHTAVSISYVDLLTSEIALLEVDAQDLSNEIGILNPREIILSEKLSDDIKQILAPYQRKILYQVDSNFAEKKCENTIKAFYNINSIESIGALSSAQIGALGSILEYINITQKQNAPLLPLPRILNKTDYISLDSNTKKNLEIFSSISGSKKHCLFGVINHTVTKPGSRLLHKFLSSPLKNVNMINDRLNITEFFFSNFAFTQKVRLLLENIWDIERITTKISSKKASPKDLILLKQSIDYYLKIQDIIIHQFGLKLEENVSNTIYKTLPELEHIKHLIEDSIIVDAPNVISEGGFIKHAYHPRVEQLYQIIDNNQSIIERLKIKYQQQTGIDTLKINHNNVLGFFIEVTAKQAPKIVGEEFIHRQTTMNSARFTTQELQRLENDIVNAKVLVINLESELFSQVNEKILGSISILRMCAEILANIDVFSSLAFLAKTQNYVKPNVNDASDIKIMHGRHPVIELSSRANFIPNDTTIDENQNIIMLTGPNMGGKSTFLRQNALIVLIAQIGSFVPAYFAEIGVVDQIYTRIGAGDDLSSGQSTFMVEMLEVASILSQSTNKSLIILDEVGRGTSTYDGMSIAHAIVEYIHNKIRARCMFATHYHELTNLSKSLHKLMNYTTKIEEEDGEIIFTHKVVQGISSKSYGIHVAQLAGLPQDVVDRANQILTSLEIRPLT